jgi:hypothetical protein
MMFDSFNFWFLWAALALDVATTWYSMERGGGEANPVMRAIMRRLGVGPGLIGSHVLVGAAAWMAGPYIGPHSLWALTAAFAAVVAWNFYVISRRSKKR